VVADGAEIKAEVPLPLAGLMSDRSIERVREQLDVALAAAHELGSELHDPFMAMSFLALEVIPSLKLTDQGLVDVDKFEIVPLWAGGG
jgi:adenine deaminase